MASRTLQNDDVLLVTGSSCAETLFAPMNHIYLFAATHAVRHDHVRDELLAAGGGHAEEHRPAWVQANHSGGKRAWYWLFLWFSVSFHSVMFQFFLKTFAALMWTCASLWCACSCWWWCPSCWRGTRSWSSVRRWIWTGWWRKPSVISRETAAASRGWRNG